MYSQFLLLLMLAAPQTLPQRADLAKQALLSGKSSEAVTRYRALVKELPHDPGMRLNLALALEAAGKYAEEIEQLNLVVREKSDTFAPWLMLGMAHRKLGHAAAAADALRSALAISPNDELALVELADADLAMSNFSEAAKLLQQLADRNPDSPKAWRGLIVTYTALAQQGFARLERAAPGSPEWCLLAGRSELNDGHSTRAFALFRQALAQRPDLRGIHAALAEVYDKTGHPDWAAMEREKESRANYESSDENFHESENYRKLAAEALAKLERLPESAELLESKAESHQKQGDRTAALAEWKRAAQLAPRDRRISGKLAESLWINRSYEEATLLLTRLVAADPGEAQWQYLLGDALFRQQRSEAALPHLEAAIRQQPDLLAAQAVIGRIYLQLGQAAKAIPHLLKGLPADEAAISFQLGQAYRATGQAELAAKAFERQRELSQAEPAKIAITAPEN